MRKFKKKKRKLKIGLRHALRTYSESLYHENIFSEMYSVAKNVSPSLARLQIHTFYLGNLKKRKLKIGLSHAEFIQSPYTTIFFPEMYCWRCRKSLQAFHGISNSWYFWDHLKTKIWLSHALGNYLKHLFHEKFVYKNVQCCLKRLTLFCRNERFVLISLMCYILKK